MCLLCLGSRGPRDAAREWSRSFLSSKCEPEGAGAAMTVSAELPLPPREAFALLCHPLTAERVYSNVDRCSYRRVWWTADDGTKEIVEVETESGESQGDRT